MFKKVHWRFSAQVKQIRAESGTKRARTRTVKGLTFGAPFGHTLKLLKEASFSAKLSLSLLKAAVHPLGGRRPKVLHFLASFLDQITSNSHYTLQIT